ncbi:Putative nitric oxide synthase-interacting protein [Septoria linicola]|uniref:Nitric oxide synthase-interacting protein n=1 Tax=Septoria linicola TaxID=215465 RepID=A0A9Q9ANM9_9PEZI|nr:putative nitric oxide synthase-interacting protein [Septoria linicola]USW52822.1 Putative nitric oxide synthase-interacting protein [Septoria linicola]
MSHSKRNTSLAFFTAHEREELKGHWGSKSTRLTRDSFLPFGSCQLCLLPAREPVSCASHGHLFCRECAVSNLLAQNKELKRLKKEAARRKAEDEEEKDMETAEAQARAVEEFEKVQAGLSARVGATSNQKIVGRENGKIVVEQDVEDGATRGTKRKRIELDEDELVRLANEDRDKARKLMQEERDAKPHLPAFWVAGKTPDNKKSDVKAIKPHATCPAASAESPHEFTLKTLITVNFTEEKSSSDSTTASRSCPACNKGLSNSTKAILAKPCGHVLCKTCSDKFQKPPEKSSHDRDHDDSTRCYVCQEDVTQGRKTKRKKDAETGEKESKIERGLVELASDGTGFAGGGKSEVKKHGVAFQC